MRIGMLAVTVLAASGVVNAQGAGAGACARLAPQLKMKQAAAERGSTAAGEWRVDLLGGLGKALFGGSAASTMSVEPVADADTLDYGAYTRACVRQRIDVACKVSGPARLIVATDKTEAGIDLAAGEKVDAGIRKGRHIYCRDLR
jgi:hypothetical protein